MSRISPLSPQRGDQKRALRELLSRSQASCGRGERDSKSPASYGSQVRRIDRRKVGYCMRNSLRTNKQHVRDHVRRMPKLRWLLPMGMLAFGASLSAASAERQPGVECAAFGGAMATDKVGVEACFSTLTREVCRDRSGGIGYRANSTLPQCALNLPYERLILACSRRGGQWGRHGAAINHCYEPRVREECLAKGGSWERRGMAQVAGCVMTALDAGKVCNDGSECQFGRCLTDRPAPASTAVSGICARTDRTDGCHWLVRKGMATRGVCED